uniref:Transcriptional regulator n=1 Tax=Meloidogyne hapla TaxID=6305 RepID=A0A1I8BKU1_MELHA
MRPQIIKLFEFDKQLVAKVTAIREKLISGDVSHKLCIHTRRGDFVGVEGESKTEEINKAHSISKVYYIVDLNLTRGEELNFAQQICDSYLDTADLSSFAAWMGYLMPEDRPIFYIRRNRRRITRETLIMLPKSWIPIDESWLKD